MQSKGSEVAIIFGAVQSNLTDILGIQWFWQDGPANDDR